MKNYARKLVSFYIWGNSDIYNYGLWENALLMPKIYPGWIMSITFTPTANQKVIQELSKLPYVELECMDVPNHSKNTMLRFMPGMQPKNDVVVFRDADSRLLKRDYIAVMDWLNNTNKKAHLMRDHPRNNYKIMAGLWGVREGIIATPEVVLEFDSYFRNPEYKKWYLDQVYLSKYIYPLIQNSICVHASYNKFEKDARSFPKNAPKRHPFCGFTARRIDNAVKYFKLTPRKIGKCRKI